MESRVHVLEAAAEAIFPCCKEESAACRAAGDTRAALFYEMKGSEVNGAMLQVLAAIETRLSSDDRGQLFLLLRLLSSRLGTLLLIGRSALNPLFPSAFADLPRSQREHALLQWAAAPRMQKAFKAPKALITSALFTACVPGGNSPLLDALHYSTGPERPLTLPSAAAAAEVTVSAALADLSAASGAPGAVAQAAAALAAKGMRIKWPAAAKGVPASLLKSRPHFVVECDAVVVGSGAGGGVAAAQLAAAGLRAVVLEKAGFVPAKDFSLKEGEALGRMYEAGGLLTTENGATAVLAGSTLGGRTRINWCASFATPPHVRREWAKDLGLTAFGGEEYDAALEAVNSRLSIRATGCRHSATCSTLAVGLQGMGAHCGEVPRNCLDPKCSGHCCFGCFRGYKQDTVNTWLADACRDGARVVTGAWVDAVITQRSAAPQHAQHESSASSTHHHHPRQAVGVLALCGQAAAPLRIAFAAPVVISACGALHTPALLQRSRITARGNVGANLRLHPCTCVVGIMPTAAPQFYPGGSAPQGTGAAEGAAVRCWEGPIMSTFSNVVGDWEGSGYGALLYTPATHPGLFAAAAPWLGGRDFKHLMLQYENACAVLILVRDSGSGRVSVDSSGRPRLHYSISPQDKESMMKGMHLGLKCMAAAGAHTVMTLLNSPEGRFSFDADGAGARSGAPRASHPSFSRYLDGVAAAGVPDVAMPTFSAHQMGTACLGVDPASSVLDPAGECWECAGLFCCDGSVFPTPTGLNPMATIEAVSYLLAGGIARRAAAAKAAAGGDRRRKGRGGGDREAELRYEQQAPVPAPAKL